MIRSSALLCALLGALSACTSTLDSLGQDDGSSGGSAGLGQALRPVNPPATYNAFKELGIASDEDIEAKLETAFSSLFDPDPQSTETILVLQEPGALIKDVLHDDVRTEGMGLAMVVAVELDKREVFDQLWAFAKGKLRQESGPAQGYFNSLCDEDVVTTCLDTYGMQHFALALVLASGRWHGATYSQDALALLDLLQHGIGSPFDAKTHLVHEEPKLVPPDYTRSALEMPGAYWLWAQATGDPFWTNAAKAAREHLVNSAHPTTGLWPMRSDFSGNPVMGDFTEQAYRTHLNLALDALWGRGEASSAEVDSQKKLADRVLAFFKEQGLKTYGGTFTVAGDAIDPTHARALVSVNGALVVAASRTDANKDDRIAFANFVWTQEIPTGTNRYYDGLMYMMSLLILSGQLQVH
ncbi:MAG TPA: glycosyl hydrolase family 8 [Polyangiaceae bacterium]|nr:glycosyl hydrolase family 8 [Polyangiaceae bacterium]